MQVDSSLTTSHPPHPMTLDTPAGLCQRNTMCLRPTSASSSSEYGASNIQSVCKRHGKTPVSRGHTDESIRTIVHVVGSITRRLVHLLPLPYPQLSTINSHSKTTIPTTTTTTPPSRTTKPHTSWPSTLSPRPAAAPTPGVETTRPTGFGRLLAQTSSVVPTSPKMRGTPVSTQTHRDS